VIALKTRKDSRTKMPVVCWRVQVRSIRAQSAELPLADLRQASLEAGIAPNAFEQALVELRDTHPVADPGSGTIAWLRSRLPAALLNSMKTVGLVLATLFVLMVFVDNCG
jgi:hypothetical protein